MVRACNIAEAFWRQAHGAVRAREFKCLSDEIAHAPAQVSSPTDQLKWGSEVTFVGTWMPERGSFLARLVERGVPLTIWGDGWSKAKEWQMLRPHWRGPGLYDDDDYAMAVQCAKVCIGMLSKGNRDLCTTRSFEIPRLGGSCSALSATSEHLALYSGRRRGGVLE